MTGIFSRLNRWRRLQGRWRRLKRMQAAGMQMMDDRWFEGKRIAIIGPSETVEAELGAYSPTDFDLIARLNKGGQLALDNAGLWGPRTDILFHNLKENDGDRSAGELSDRFVKLSGLDYLVYPHAAPEKWRRNVELAAIRFTRNHSVTLCLPPLSLFSGLVADLEGLSPTTGLVAISTLLSMPLSGLGIFGFSFFSTGYVAGYATAPAAQDAPLDWARATGLHDPEKEATLVAAALARHRDRAQAFPVHLGAGVRERLAREGLEW